MRLFRNRLRPDPFARGALVLLAVCFLAGAPSGAAAGEPPVGEPSADDKELTLLRDFLVGPDRTFPTRRDAAAGLLEKDSDAARAILLEVLATRSEATLAVLDALASRDAAHEAFVDPLFRLLKGDDEPVRRSAALAFVAYQGSDKVLAGLKELLAAPETAAPHRLAAVEALAQIVDRRSIEALVEATGDVDPAVGGAAALALADMTGLRQFGVSPERWKAWWQVHQAEPESKFLCGLLRRFRTELRRREADLEAARSRLANLLNEIYEVADAKEKVRLIQAHLEETLPQMRVVAARQATLLGREVITGNNGTRAAYQELLAALKKHVLDESPQVRAAAAEALAAWQETAAGPALLARLEAEKVPEVRAALAGALGTLKVVDAVPKLVAMLESPQQAEVVRAAGALGSIGEQNPAGAAPIEPALEPLGRLARAAPDAAVREAACRALAKIAHPSAEPVLLVALEDQVAGVRFSAAQGLGNLRQVGDRTVEALAARLRDDNKGVRQVVAAAMARLGPPEAARRIAERLKAGAEPDATVRSAFWIAIESLVARSDGPDLARDLGDWFLALEGAEQRQRAAALYETALAKYPASAADSDGLRELRERLVDAYVAAGTPDRAVPSLRQLLQTTPPEDATRVRQLKEQLGLILLAREPHTEGATLLAEAMEGLGPPERVPLLKAVQARAEALLKAEQPDRALDLLTALKSAKPDWGGTELGPALEQLQAQARQAAVALAIARLSAAPEQAAAATQRLKALGKPAALGLLDALEAAAKANQADAETRVLAALETVTPRPNHGYVRGAPLEKRLAAIQAWRDSL